MVDEGANQRESQSVESTDSASPAPQGNDDTPEECGKQSTVPSSLFPIVGFGASAGGLDAFNRLLSALPPDSGMAFVLVQHLAAAHPSALAEILSRATKMPVREVQDETAVEPNHVYVIPPGQTLVIANGCLQLRPRPASGPHRPIDGFFCALAEDQGHQAIGVVLSGTATDGTVGLKAIKAAGGITFAQDDTAQQEGMPQSAIASGCVDFVLPPDEIAREIARISRHPFTASQSDTEVPPEGRHFDRIMELLRRATGVDFSNYKANTLRRRVARRMVLKKMEGLAEYAQLVQGSSAEAEALYQDILINVTTFFRDPEAFETLKAKVFPRVIETLRPNEPLRVWILGCSTGQEAYSVAMAFAEFAESTGSRTPLQLFATDLNATGVDKARAGVYPKEIADEMSPERLRRFFVEVDGHYRISKAIREACVFSRHNALTDPPFSRIDLITCRNLLIYLEPVLQQRILPILHYALKPAGFLWLGNSETIGRYRNLFQAEDTKRKIDAKKPGLSAAHFPVQVGAVRHSNLPSVGLRSPADAGADLHKEADRVLLAKFAPPGVLVSADLEILQFRGDTGAYLAPAPGKASLNLLKMLREGLLVTVRAALLQAGQKKMPVRKEGLRVKTESGQREVAVEIIPVLSKAKGGNEGGFLILFEGGRESPSTAVDSSAPNNIVEASAQPTDLQVADQENARLQQELSATRDFLQSVIEQQESANEELQSANEEVQSSNEELQSINEELETSKEEIQSSNEELVTVNDELNNRNLELDRANNDLVNLLGSVQLPIVMVGRDLRVRRFNAAAEKLLKLNSADLGRQFTDIKLNFDLPDLEPLLTDVLEKQVATEHDVRDKQGRWYSLRLRPYTTLENKVDGIVVMLVDVDTIKEAHAFTASIVATVREPLLVLDKDLRVRTASHAFYETFHVTAEQTENRLLYELGNGEWNIPDLRRLLEEVLPRDNQINDFVVERDFEQIGIKTMLLNARRLMQTVEQAPLILLAIEDLTNRDAAKNALRESEERFRALFDLGPVAVYSCDLSGRIQEYNRRAVELWGRKPIPGDTDERFCGSHMMHLPDGTLLPHEQCPMAEVLSGAIPEARDVEVTIERPDGSRVAVIVNIVPLTNERGETTGAINCFYDITERKRFEVELREADRRKDEFLATLAHELRGPLSPLSNMLEIMKRESRGSSDDVMQHVHHTMGRQLRQMTRLIDDLLDVSRISRGKFELQRKSVELASVVYQAIEACRPAVDRAQQELTVTLPPEPVYVDADPVRLAQVFGNLLNNACKYTEAKGHLSLTAEQQGGDLAVSVKDSGIGIPADMLPNVFKMFTQVDHSLERSQGGLGIGLTVVQRLVEMHGGSVEAFSEGPGRGSEFVVHLPIVIETPKMQPPAEPADSETTTNGRRILVVDDNRDSADTLAMLLNMTGNETQIARDGQEAIEAAAAFRPDAVLLDIGMPKVNGYDACRKIRKQASGGRIVLIALTGWGQDEDRRKSQAAGFDGHLVKPVDHAELQKLLADLLPTPV